MREQRTRGVRLSRPVLAGLALACGGCGDATEAPPEPTDNPLPTLTAVAPGYAIVGAGNLIVTLTGTDFVSGLAFRVDGGTRPVEYLSAAQVRATILASDLASAGVRSITVANPTPGGGVSNPLSFEVWNHVPVLTALDPNVRLAGGNGFTLVVRGAAFVPSSAVRWNGEARPTTFVSADTLRAEIGAVDVATARQVPVTVVTPGPGGGASQPLMFQVASTATIDQVANDLAYDANRNRLFASVPSSAAAYGNTVIAIDLATKTIDTSLFVGSEPGRLALSDNAEYLYVALDGANAVRRVDLATWTAGLQFEVRAAQWTAAFRVEDMDVMPGNPGTLVVSAMNIASSPRLVGVIVFDDGVPRDTIGPGHTGANRIEFSGVADTVYGYNTETTEFGFYKLAVTVGGIHEVSIQTNLISGFGVDIAYAGGRVYATNGAVIDPGPGTLLGTIGASGPVLPDPDRSRVYVLAGSSVEGFDWTTFTSKGSAYPAGVSEPGVGSLVRWGTTGLAFRTASKIVIWETDLVTR